MYNIHVLFYGNRFDLPACLLSRPFLCFAPSSRGRENILTGLCPASPCFPEGKKYREFLKGFLNEGFLKARSLFQWGYFLWYNKLLTLNVCASKPAAQ
jgi:hypothetical protein